MTNAPVRFGVGFLALLLLAPLGSSEQRHSTLRSVSLERTPCFGGCPVYKVTINADGTVDYRGTRFVDRIGKYKAQVWPGTLEKLDATLTKLKFQRLKTKYAVHVTDQATQIVTISRSSGTKTVTEYGMSGPPELWAVQTLIDGLLQHANGWEKVSD